jgi:hypothetical protein
MSVDKVRGSTYISVGLKKLVGPPPEIYIFSHLLIVTISSPETALPYLLLLLFLHPYDSNFHIDLSTFFFSISKVFPFS